MKDTLIKMLENMGEDVCYDWDKGNIEITLRDIEFFGFNWKIVRREYDWPGRVKQLINWLDKNSSKKTVNFYTDYTFDGFTVRLGYMSMDM